MASDQGLHCLLTECSKKKLNKNKSGGITHLVFVSVYLCIFHRIWLDWDKQFTYRHAPGPCTQVLKGENNLSINCCISEKKIIENKKAREVVKVVSVTLDFRPKGEGLKLHSL